MVKIRLKRMGRKKKPFYRIVVADARAPRDGKVIEEIGYYNPLLDPPDVKLDLPKVDQWISNGAQPTKTVVNIINHAREDAKTDPERFGMATSIDDERAVSDVMDDQGANTAEELGADMVMEAESLEAQGE